MPPTYADVSLTRAQAAAVFPGCCPYVRGPTYTRQDCATFEFKSGSPDHSGGGYPRWRSMERGTHVHGDGTRTVFVAVHRLAAVAWCYAPEWTTAEVCADLHGRDVHHELGFPSTTLEDHLSVIDHDRHAGLSRTERLAYAKDRKRRVEREQERLDAGPRCSCGADAEATVDGEELCLDCATDAAAGRDVTIEL